MFDWILKKPHLTAVGLTGTLFLSAMPEAAFAQPAAPVSPAQFDPSDVYFQGYLATREAEKLEAKGDFAGAAAHLKKAQKMFSNVSIYYPDWKSSMVKGRIELNQQALEKIQPKADEQRLKSGRAVAELEGGIKQPVEVTPSKPTPAPPKTILQADPVLTRRLAEAEAEVKRLRELAKNNPPQTTPPKDSLEASRNESRIRDIARQRDLLQSQLNAAENNLQTLRSRLAASPAESELTALNQKISGLEQERQAMAMALQQSRGAHTEALARNAALEADLKIVQQKRADLERDIKKERDITNSVVEGQRAQLQALEKELEAKSGELAKANERITSLTNELQESKDAFSALRSERDSLLLEREQMSAMLKLNEEGRINDLIQQNMGLAKDLREANEKVERLNIDNNATKDQVVEGLRDLAIAKARINRLHQERREQDERLTELKNRLESETKALADQQSSTIDPAEAEVLRDIIHRQLRVQERRRQATTQLIEAAKEMANKDDSIAEAVQLLDGQDVQLTPDEQRLIANDQVDGEFVSPFAQDPKRVGANTTELNRDIAVFERTAEKAYAAERYATTRELFQLIIEQNPGHTDALCKLGVVNLKLDDATAAADSFRRAVELDPNKSYAHRMLGLSLKTLGDLPGAEEALKKAAELEPSDAQNHLLLGYIALELGHLGEAEAHYKDAISADPLSSDAHYNLALLCANDKRLEQAQEYYQQALEHGAQPNPKLEQVIAQQP
ncbi:MAG: tetratricopeptide repeat protein [Akkermansiaceae bacterium]|nr:tetratricopeptide repeat protein [Akkermansiaceae bacterium]